MNPTRAAASPAPERIDRFRGERGRNQLGRTLMRIRDDIRRRARPAMDAQHADWLRGQCDLERAGRCDREVCRRRSGWRHDAGGAPSCIPLEIRRRLDRAETIRTDATEP